MITQDIQPETSALLASLTIQRNHVLGILEGLTDDQLRRPVLPSGWSCLGMVQHLTISDERFWLRGIVGGDSACVSASADEAKAEAIWQVAPDAPAAAVLEAYRQQIELADAVIAATPLDQPPAIWPTEIWPRLEAAQPSCGHSARHHRDRLSRRSPRRGPRAHRRPPVDDLNLSAKLATCPPTRCSCRRW